MLSAIIVSIVVVAIMYCLLVANAKLEEREELIDSACDVVKQVCKAGSCESCLIKSRIGCDRIDCDRPCDWEEEGEQ